MATVTVHGGDFLEGVGTFSPGTITSGAFVLRTSEHPWVGESIPLSQLEIVEVASEDSVKRIGGTIAWAAAGALALGPVGLLAGLVLGGKRKEVTFVARFRDGRKLLATTDSGTFIKLQAAVL